jgi:hypothetical protein
MSVAMRIPKPIVVLVIAAVAGPAFAGPPANAIDVTPRTESAAVVVLRGSSAPPQPLGRPPAAQASRALQAPAPTYGGLAYAPAYVFLPRYFQAPPRRVARHIPPTAPLAAPAYPIKPWGVGLAPFQR